MRTATSKFVTVLDVCVVVGACISAVLSALIGRKNVQEMNKKLREVIFQYSFVEHFSEIRWNFSGR